MEYGLQLYSVRDEMKADVAKAIAAVAKIGYKQAEFAGFFGHTAEEIRAMLEENGMTVCGTHTHFEEVTPEQIDATIAYHKIIGNKRLIIPGYDLSTPEKIDSFVELVNFAGPRLAAAGITLGYHNHSGEFLPREDGTCIWEELYARTNIIFEIDTYWAFVAGRDPVALLEKYHDRVPVIHLKDGTPEGRGYSLGLGSAPVKQVIATAKRYGMDMVVESEAQEPTGPAEVGRCFDFLKVNG